MILSTHGIVGSQILQASGLLIDYPGAAAAYSLRLLRTNYTGSAIRVRRSSDNAEQDIGFTTLGVLDTATLTSFCSGTNGFVKTWYDQSGNGRDATQTTAANQPQIVSSGSVILENGKPAIQGTASTGFATATIQFSSFTNLSFFMVQKTQFSSSLQMLFESSTNFNNNIGAIINYQFNTTTYSLGFRTGLSSMDYIVNDYKNVINGRTLINSYLDSSKTGLLATQMLANNNALTETIFVDSGSSNFSDQNLHLFSRAGNSFGVIGNYQEFVMYGSNQLSNQNGINLNINSFYSIY